VIGREGAGSDFLISLSVKFYVVFGGFAPRQLRRWPATFATKTFYLKGNKL